MWAFNGFKKKEKKEKKLKKRKQNLQNKLNYVTMRYNDKAGWKAEGRECAGSEKGDKVRQGSAVAEWSVWERGSGGGCEWF